MFANEVVMEKRRECARSYYERNRDAIITHKTLVKIRETGRWPRDSTIAAHNIDQGLLYEALSTYARENPGTKAGVKILARLGRRQP